MDRRALIVTGLSAASLGASASKVLAQAVSEPSELPPAQPQPGYPMNGGAPAEGPSMAPSPYGGDPADAGGYPAEPDAYPAEADPLGADAPEAPSPRMSAEPSYPARTREQVYSRNEVVNNVSDFLGVPAEAAAGAVERIFRDNGQPTAYIAGEEASGAVAVGLRYGRGLLYMKGRKPMQVYWQGPSVGWDFGGNASRVFTLAYNLLVPDMVFRRFPGVEGSAYFIGGLGVNYQRAEGVTLAPIRAGVGLRLGANVGYLSYSRKRRVLPF